MGDTGPCGPCSEIFIDHGDHMAGGPPGSPDEDGDRFMEFWNLVFMQFDQGADGKRTNLPKPSIDTGMGLERIAAVLQGKHDIYDVDLFRTLIAASESLTGVKAEGDQAPSHRVIADHLRSSCFLIADGVSPSNEGRGYVLRRIMRRAMRHAHLLGAADPLMHRLAPTLIEEMGAAYPELARAQPVIESILLQEEERFRGALGRGMALLEEATAALKPGGGAVRRDRLQALRHLRLPAGPHPGRGARQGPDRGHRGLRRGHGRAARAGARGLDRLGPGGPGNRVAGPARPAGPHRVQRLRPERGHRRDCWPSSPTASRSPPPRPARRWRRCSTAPPSTPKAAARRATRALSNGRAAAAKVLDVQRRAGDLHAHQIKIVCRHGWKRACASA